MSAEKFCELMVYMVDHGFLNRDSIMNVHYDMVSNDARTLGLLEQFEACIDEMQVITAKFKDYKSKY